MTIPVPIVALLLVAFAVAAPLLVLHARRLGRAGAAELEAKVWAAREERAARAGTGAERWQDAYRGLDALHHSPSLAPSPSLHHSPAPAPPSTPRP